MRLSAKGKGPVRDPQEVPGTAEHEDLFIEMLEFLIPGKHITSVTMLNREYNGLVNSEKKVTFDLLCRDEDSGEEFLVEMQNAYSRSYCDRVLYYSYYPLREQLAKKEKELISDEKGRGGANESLELRIRGNWPPAVREGRME